MAAARVSPAACPDHLFTIERSKNANLVVYDARRTASGDLDPKEPVVVYWLMNAEKGQREDLNRIERQRAYGFDVAAGPESGQFRLTLKSGKKHPFTVALRDGCAVVLDEIDGRPAILERIYVRAKDDGIHPKVESIQFFGRDAADGSPRTETTVPKS
jgi:hypothetical protein